LGVKVGLGENKISQKGREALAIGKEKSRRQGGKRKRSKRQRFVGQSVEERGWGWNSDGAV